MENNDIQRRLAAILVADVVGYSKLMENDQEAAFAAWRTARLEVVDPEIAAHKGRIVKHTGDGFVAEFATVFGAVECAVEIQQKMNGELLNFRMGINLGDIIVDGEDIHGDGVNIAARLEGFAEAGGICISSGIYDQVRKRLDCGFEDLGEQPVKNIADPIRIYRLLLDAEYAGQ